VGRVFVSLFDRSQERDLEPKNKYEWLSAAKALLNHCHACSALASKDTQQFLFCLANGFCSKPSASYQIKSYVKSDPLQSKAQRRKHSTSQSSGDRFIFKICMGVLMFCALSEEEHIMA